MFEASDVLFNTAEGTLDLWSRTLKDYTVTLNKIKVVPFPRISSVNLYPPLQLEIPPATDSEEESSFITLDDCAETQWFKETKPPTKIAWVKNAANREMQVKVHMPEGSSNGIAYLREWISWLPTIQKWKTIRVFREVTVGFDEEQNPIRKVIGVVSPEYALDHQTIVPLRSLHNILEEITGQTPRYAPPYVTNKHVYKMRMYVDQIDILNQERRLSNVNQDVWLGVSLKDAINGNASFEVRFELMHFVCTNYIVVLGSEGFTSNHKYNEFYGNVHNYLQPKRINGVPVNETEADLPVPAPFPAYEEARRNDGDWTMLWDDFSKVLAVRLLAQRDDLEDTIRTAVNRIVPDYRNEVDAWQKRGMISISEGKFLKNMIGNTTEMTDLTSNEVSWWDMIQALTNLANTTPTSEKAMKIQELAGRLIRQRPIARVRNNRSAE
jgi:hypothetical protein